MNFSLPNTDAESIFTDTVGNGTFTFGSTLDTIDYYNSTTYDPAAPYGIKLADFDEDGNLDIVESDVSTHALRIRRGDGAGSFTTLSTTATSEALYDLVVGDFNNDGHVDVAGLQSGINAISYYFGDGAGSFASEATFASSAGVPTILRVGDMNNDSYDDLILGMPGDGKIDVWFADGSGAFGSSQIGLGASTSLSDIWVGDYDNDGDFDIFTADGSDQTMSYYVGDGMGGFSALATFALGYKFDHIQVGDIDGDMTNDFAFSSPDNSVIGLFLSSNSFVEVDWATSAGLRVRSTTETLAISTETPLTISLMPIQATTITGFISTIQLILVRRSTKRVILIRRWFIQAQLRTMPKLLILTAMESWTLSPQTLPYSFDIGDLDGDGKLDLVNLDYNGGTLSVHYGRGNGTFAPRSTITLSATTDTYSPFSLMLTDLNGDGVKDFVTANSGRTASILISGTQGASANRRKIDISTQAKAEDVLNILNNALENLKSAQASVSVLHERLDFAASSNLLMSENLQEAKENSFGVDYALEIAELVRNQILQQAQVAVLAQANLDLQIIAAILQPLK